MSKYDLSILIPARNEMFLKNTVEDILKNKRGKTQVLVGLDGKWSDPPLVDHPDVDILYVSEPLGQRAMTNALCRMSKAKYVMKLDAHCALDEGFDVKMMEEMHDDWTMVPAMYNLHAFDWKCMKCGKKTYQGRTPLKCEDCDNTTDFKRKMYWKPRLNKRTEFWKFDSDLHFQYWYGYRKRPEAQGDIADTMSLIGACWMLTRDKYWELNICDENFGSWGQQGTEIACKTWLSGGRLVVNRKTWFSHMFRTQGGDFGFPYPQSQQAVNRAREYSKKLFKENSWPGQVRPLSWMIEKFWPIEGNTEKGDKGWSQEELDKLKESEKNFKVLR